MSDTKPGIVELPPGATEEEVRAAQDQAKAFQPKLPIQQQLFNMPGEALSQALPCLRRPFTPQAVKWKIQSATPKEDEAKWALIVGYIDARLVMERLNMVCGGSWSEKPVRVEGQANALMYELTVFDQTHIDIGVGQGQSEDMKLKAIHSDALKRTAVRFGVGVSLYAMPQFWLPVAAEEHEEGGAPTIKRISGGKKKGRPSYLKDIHEAFLRERYQAWLEAEGIEAFGEPLDHGDALKSVGDLAEGVEDENDAPSRSEPLADEQAIALSTEARKLRDEIRAIDDGALPAQSFDAAMGQREHSHERLEDFVGNLTELLADVRRFDELQTELAQVLEDEAEWKKIIDHAQRRASRRERVEVLEKALAEAKGGEPGDS